MSASQPRGPRFVIVLQPVCCISLGVRWKVQIGQRLQPATAMGFPVSSRSTDRTPNWRPDWKPEKSLWPAVSLSQLRMRMAAFLPGRSATRD